MSATYKFVVEDNPRMPNQMRVKALRGARYSRAGLMFLSPALWDFLRPLVEKQPGIEVEDRRPQPES